MKFRWLALMLSAVIGTTLLITAHYLDLSPLSSKWNSALLMNVTSSPASSSFTTPTSSQEPITTDSRQSIHLPSYDAVAGAPRANAAAARVRPLLEAELASKELHWGDPIFLRAFKEEAELEVFVRHRTSKKFVLLKSYKIAKQSGILGPKQREGDGQVPEGFYYAGPSAMKPDSTFHLAINCGYPNAYDRAHQRTGSFIMIHGNCVSIGCLAMTDPIIEEIYSLCDAALQGGQNFFRIHLFPFRMKDERIATTTESPWHEFWKNLKEGYDSFETHRVPPEVKVKNLRYEFSQGMIAPEP